MERIIKFREFVHGRFHYWGFLQEGMFQGPATPSLTRGKHDQFTGLLDKNAKEIYEGDIISIPDDYDSYGWMAGEKREVYFAAGCFRLKPKWNHSIGHTLESDMEKCEIIGNIHESPDLLNTDHQ